MTKIMKAAKTLGAVAAMWWVMMPMADLWQGGQRVGVWFGPFETRSICEAAREGFMRGFYKSAALNPDGAAQFDPAVCTYQTP
jgi:hypothetical protein